MATIDTDKLTKVFDHLAETKDGHKSLIQFREAIEELRNGLPKNLPVNNHEFLSLVQKLVFRMNPSQLSPAAGALSDDQLNQVVGGAMTSSMFTVDKIQRLGDIRSIGNLGFNIMIVA